MPDTRVGTPASEVENPEVEKPYFPFQTARPTGILPNPFELAQELNHSLIDDFTQAKLPNYKQAGLVKIGENKIVAFDLVAAEYQDGKLVIMPASKKAVQDGKVKQQGLIIAGEEESLVTVAGVAVDSIRYWWYVDSMRQARRVVATIGNTALCLGNGLEWPKLEPKEKDLETGAITVDFYNRIFSFR